jgi:23S rRNA-/tRNA-specific pseudouridylate synthase
VDGVVVRDPGHRLTARATLRYERRPWAEPLAPAHLDVVYADEHGVVAVAKPSGLQVGVG